MKRIIAPLAIIFAGIAIAAGLIATGPKISARPTAAVAPLVRVVTVTPQTVQLQSSTHGTVAPRTESELIPEVAGRVIALSDNLVSGGFFSAGDVLLEIDPLDYELALEQARAEVVRADSELQTASRDAARFKDLVARKLASTAQQDDAINRQRIAEAGARRAQALLARAERDLQRTKVIAPFDGRVRSEMVDIGQYVRSGTAIGMIYATDMAEVTMPVHDEELAFLNLPLGRNTPAEMPPASVTLQARFAGAEHQWQGVVARTEGELDPRTRMINIVARVDDPYSPQAGKPPLAVGLFVEATIHGRTVDDIIILPRSALRSDGQLMIVDAENRLRFRPVQILRIVDEQVYIQSGLEAGERVCISNLGNAMDGMLVRTIDQSEPDNNAVPVSQAAS